MPEPAKPESNLVVIAALVANLGIAVAKFVAAGISGSSSMLTEGVHSVVDSLNQVLLLYGQHRAKRPPDRDHPFGYGRELYFWSFVVALLIFAVGAGVSVYEGWRHIQEPEPLKSPLINYIVLAVSFALEGTSWTIAMRAFSQSKGDLGWWAAIRESKDPGGFIVLFEDSAALAGLAVAAIGVWASHHYGDPRIDGVASIAIGLMLGGVAAYLAREAKGLLIGERADPAVIARVRAIVLASPRVTAVNRVRTIHTAPTSIFVAISADFDDSLTMGEAETLIEGIEDELRAAEPMLSSIYIRPERSEDAADVPPQRPDLSRRDLAGLCIAGAFLPASAFAQSTDFVIDWQGGSETPAVAASLAAQIALVRKLRIKPDIAVFFASQPITVDLADDTHTRAGPRGVFFERRAVPADNPVLLHELLHRYHLLRLPGGFRNPTIMDFYEAAKSGGKFPAEAYMLKNVQEFFAMTTSVVLHGRAARPPFVRANVAEKLPELYRWVIGEFGLVV